MIDEIQIVFVARYLFQRCPWCHSENMHVIGLKHVSAELHINSQ